MLKIEIEGTRLNQYRLIHSKKFRGYNFIKTRNHYSKEENLTEERNVITEYLSEKIEMDYTFFLVLQILSAFLFAMIILGVLLQFPVAFSFYCLGGSIVSYLVSNKRKQDFATGEMGIEMSESFYNNKIKEKFNL